MIAPPKRRRSGWSVYLSEPGKIDLAVEVGLSERAARAEARRRNRQLLVEDRGRMPQAPFAFYYVRHGMFQE